MTATTEKSATRRQRVLDAALDVFSREGYGNAAVDEIARRSDTSKGGVYFHFPSKQLLFLALVDAAGKLLLDRVRQAIESESTATAKGDAALLAVLRTFGSHRPLARLLLIEALGAGREFTDHLAELHTEFARVIETYLDAAVAAGEFPPMDTRVASVAWFGAVNQTVTRWVLTGEPERLEDAYPELRRLLLHGIAGCASESAR